MNKNNSDLGHAWKWSGDVKQCKHCKTYLGLWDGKKPCVKKP